MPVKFSSLAEFQRSKLAGHPDAAELRIRREEKQLEQGGPIFTAPRPRSSSSSSSSSSSTRSSSSSSTKRSRSRIRHHAGRPVRHALRSGHRRRAGGVLRTLFGPLT